MKYHACDRNRKGIDSDFTKSEQIALDGQVRKKRDMIGVQIKWYKFRCE